MIARDALVSTAPKVVEILLVEGAEDVRHDVAVVVYSMSNLERLLDGSNCQFCGWNNKTFIDKNVCSRWMVHSHQRQLIVIISFPKLRCDTEIVETVARHKFIAANFVPFFRSFDASGAKSIDAKSDRRPPGNGVFDKLHLLPVVGEQERT